MLNDTNVNVETRVGLAVLATDRSLHLYVDGTERGVVAPHVPDPCYFMFDLGYRCTKVVSSCRGLCCCFWIFFLVKEGSKSGFNVYIVNHDG